MAKGWILLGYAAYFWYLDDSGDLNKYINMKYAYMIYLAIAGFLILALIQFANAFRQKALEPHAGHDHDHDHEHACADPHCGHDHHKKQKPIVYFLYLLPLLCGFDLPVATLDSHMVLTKGIHFPTMQQGTQWNKWNQILQPDTTLFYSQADYNAIMSKQLATMKEQPTLIFNDQNYLLNMETLYKNQSDFQGKQIELDGFVYNDPNLAAGHSFLLRFGMVHCILDSGVYGLMVTLPPGTTFQNDEWYHVTGTLTKAYYGPIQGMIPCVEIDKAAKIDPPKQPYVYRN